MSSPRCSSDRSSRQVSPHQLGVRKSGSGSAGEDLLFELRPITRVPRFPSSYNADTPDSPDPQNARRGTVDSKDRSLSWAIRLRYPRSRVDRPISWIWSNTPTMALPSQLAISDATYVGSFNELVNGRRGAEGSQLRSRPHFARRSASRVLRTKPRRSPRRRSGFSPHARDR